MYAARMAEVTVAQKDSIDRLAATVAAVTSEADSARDVMLRGGAEFHKKGRKGKVQKRVSAPY